MQSYKAALSALSARTGAPLPSLIISFGILHEVTAIVPLVAVFYGSRTLGIGETVVSAIVSNPTAEDSFGVKRLVRSWVEEGDAWAGRIGRRYGVFGYEKRTPGASETSTEVSPLSSRLAGDVANAIVAYGVTKLRLKRTPEEEAAHQFRKQQRREKKRKRQHEQHHSAKRQHFSDDDWDKPDSEPSQFQDHDRIRAELEEQRFREKMFDAFADDERLDALEARLNDFAHVPGRWRADGSKPGKAVYDGDDDEVLKADPRYMDDEEYAEWIRLGIKTHAAEFAEEQRKKEMKAQRRAEEKARRLETERLEKLAEEERRRKKLERDDRRRQYAREEYELRWTSLLLTARSESDESNLPELRFHDIPWPILIAYRQKRGSTDPVRISAEHLTTDAILEFLIPPSSRSMADPTKAEVNKKERKEKLRETFLRFHPDKFEGRFMKLVRESERESVREAIGQVVRSLNTLMNDAT
ncbi:hypothetical protein H0H92_007656 [Tricholoma furcatifolium]|nr:hypothetical protein H0H92_007656 [Tricholoma furcatifolium]